MEGGWMACRSSREEEYLELSEVDWN